MYLPAQQTCSQVSAVEPSGAGPGIYGMAARSFLAPEAGDNVGVIHAINAVTGRTEWTWAQRAGMQSLMTTGGGLLFAGDSHGRFRAMDQQDGKVLWEINLGSPVTGYPATFEVDGHQYVAVSTGFWLADSYTPELIHGRQNTLYVFALPEAGTGHRGPVKAPINRPGELVAVDPAQRAAPARTVGGGVFSAEQALAGRAVYTRSCAACHGANFEPAQGTPPLKGAAFLANWRGRTVGELFALVRQTMPPGAGGSLPEGDYLAAIAYILEANGFPPGQPLPTDQAGLRAIGFEENAR
jgi:alcohol dehydrogenase (cytochrome c)